MLGYKKNTVLFDMQNYIQQQTIIKIKIMIEKVIKTNYNDKQSIWACQNDP